MAGYDDPRFLQLKIEQMQRDIEQLKRSTLPLLSYQKGPTPGWMNAAQIGPGPGMKSAMHLNLDGNQVGVAPRQTVTDANGTVRYEAGNLAANGVSGAQYGWRVNDGNHVPIADAIGLSQVMSQLGRGDVPSGPSPTFTTTSFVAVSGCSVTFSLVRTARILALFAVTGFSNTATGQVDVFVDGVDVPSLVAADNSDAQVWFGSNGPSVTSSNFYSGTQAAGSHTVDLRGKVQGTPGTLTVQGATVFVYLLGT